MVTCSQGMLTPSDVELLKRKITYICMCLREENFQALDTRQLWYVAVHIALSSWQVFLLSRFLSLRSRANFAIVYMQWNLKSLIWLVLDRIGSHLLVRLILFCPRLSPSHYPNLTFQCPFLSSQAIIWGLTCLKILSQCRHSDDIYSELWLQLECRLDWYFGKGVSPCPFLYLEAPPDWCDDDLTSFWLYRKSLAFLTQGSWLSILGGLWFVRMMLHKAVLKGQSLHHNVFDLHHDWFDTYKVWALSSKYAYLDLLTPQLPVLFRFPSPRSVFLTWESYKCFSPAFKTWLPSGWCSNNRIGVGPRIFRRPTSVLPPKDE